MKLRVASNPGDYAKVSALLKAEGVDMGEHSLTTPTIVAYDGDKVVGVVGTTIQDKMVIAGPLVLESSHRRVFLGIRLIEAYENAMRNIGVKTYIIGVEPGSLLARVKERYYPDLKPYAEEGGMMFFTRRLDGSQERPHGRTEGKGSSTVG